MNFLIYEENFLFFFISEVGITIKFCVFLLPSIDSLRETKLGVILALFANFECICPKSDFFRHFANIKKES
jgi:hypothetical protein